MDGFLKLPYSPDMNEGTLIQLFGPKWPGCRTASGRYVIDSEPDHSPWAAIVKADSHRVLPRDQVESKAWDVAVLWLGALPGAWSASGEGRLAIATAHAAEFVMDAKRLQIACGRLQTSNLVASVPIRGRITVMVDTPRHRALLMGETRTAFDNARGDRVCAFPFLIQNGKLTGLVMTAPVEQKAWWKVW